MKDGIDETKWTPKKNIVNITIQELVDILNDGHPTWSKQ